MDGFSAEEIFNKPVGYTYDDLILLPGGKPIDFGIDQVDLTSQLTPKIELKIPFVSSPMDTVTEHRTAIALALNGGIGIIHCNNTIEEQVHEVERVKKYQNGFVADPVIFSAENTISDIKKGNYHFSTFPITETGTIGSRLLGVVSDRETDFELPETKLGELMRTELVTAKAGITLQEANALLKEKKIGFLPILDQEENLVSLVCKKDILNHQHFPLATQNPTTGQLRVGAAINTRDFQPRIDALVKAGVDVIVIDSSQGNSVFQYQALEYLKSKYVDQVEAVAGNIITSDQARALLAYQPDGLRIGMGSGSICTTQSVCAVGRPQATAVHQISAYLAKEKRNVPVIADGGVANSGHIIRALTIGANTVMMGSMFAGTDEAPGDVFYENGVRLKKYRGMGSLEAMKKRSGTSADRYFSDQKKLLIPQGVSGAVVSKGSIHRYVPRLAMAVKHGFQDLAHRSVVELHGALRDSSQRFQIRSPTAQREGNVHDLHSFTN